MKGTLAFMFPGASLNKLELRLRTNKSAVLVKCVTRHLSIKFEHILQKLLFNEPAANSDFSKNANAKNLKLEITITD